VTSRRWNPRATPFLDRARATALRRLARLGEDARALGSVDQTIVAVSSAQGVIDNGGFRYFFGSNWPGRPPYSFFSDAYRAIGARKAARLIDQGAALFAFDHPERKGALRKRLLKSLPDTHRLIVLGDRVCGDMTVWTQLERYAKQHTRQPSVSVRRPNKRMQLTKRGDLVGRRPR
jgi:hypothetical protein